MYEMYFKKCISESDSESELSESEEEKTPGFFRHRQLRRKAKLTRSNRAKQRKKGQELRIPVKIQFLIMLCFTGPFLSCTCGLLLLVAESDSEEEEDSEGEMSSQASRRRYPSRGKNSRSTRLIRNSAGADRKRTGKHDDCLQNITLSKQTSLDIILNIFPHWLVFSGQSRDERSQRQIVSQRETSPPGLRQSNIPGL